MNLDLLWSFLGFLIGFGLDRLAQYYIHKNHQDAEKRSAKAELLHSFMAGSVSFIFMMLLLANNDMKHSIEEINTKIHLNANLYTNTTDYINNQTSENQKILRIKMATLDQELVNITKGDIPLTRQEMFQLWQMGFENVAAKDSVLATNLISKKDWDFGPGQEAARIQDNALHRGVKIKRIMIVGANVPDDTELLKLGKLQIRDGVSVKQINIDRFDEVNIQNDFNKFYNVKDFVIFGNKYLLLTYVDRKESRIQRAIMSIDPEKIKAANEVYRWLWNNASTIENNHDRNIHRTAKH